MSSEREQRFESLQREFSAYVDCITKQAPKAKSKAKQVVAVEPLLLLRWQLPKRGAGSLKQMRPLQLFAKLTTYCAIQ